MEPFNIAGISFVPELWKPRRNLKAILGHIDAAVAEGAQVVATPEGAVDGYISKDVSKNRIREVDRGSKGFEGRVKKFRRKQVALAEEIKRDCIPALRAKAAEHGIHLFANTLDLRRNGKVFNTTFVIGPDGKLMGKFDKVHAGFEVVNALGKGYPVFETPYAPIGVLICADRQFPEAARCVALNGARVLIINSYGMYGEGANERFIRQRAYENGFYLLFCHPNETVLISPEGRIIAATCSWEHVLVRRIDPRETIGLGVFGNRQMARTYEPVKELATYHARYAENLDWKKRRS